MSILNAKKLSKKYSNGRYLFEDLSFEMASNEKIALLGPSGSGKSTLLHILSGIEPATAGNVSLMGKDLFKLEENELLQLRKAHTGTIFQFFHLLPTLTARENAAFSLQLLGVDVSEQEERVQNLFSKLGLESRSDAWPSEMSGGEMQRVAIARAIAHRPKIIFADEPTGNLDESTGRIVLDTLASLCDEEQTALLMVTHSREAAGICDRVFRLEHGHLVEQ
jgi:ABC-type lipoprotein export system ATPase subunit